MRKKNSTALKTIVIFTAAILACAFMFFSYIRLVDSKASRTSRNYLSEMLTQSTKSLRMQISMYQESLQAYANELVKNHGNDIFSQETLAHIQESAKISPFSRLIIAKPSGECIIDGGEMLNVSKTNYFRSAMNGTTSLSNNVTLWQKENNEICNCATPIYYNKEIIGVLIATLDRKNFETVLSSSFFSGEGKLYISNENGAVLFTADNKFNTSNDVINIDKAMDEMDDKTREKINADIKLGKSGLVDFNTSSGKFHIGYSPLLMQGWCINTVVSDTTISLESAEIKQITIAFLLTFSVLCLGLLCFILAYYNKSRTRIEQTTLQLETVIANIPGGVVQFAYDDNLSIRFLNEGLLTLTGYTLQQVATELQNNFLNLVHDGDRARLSVILVDQMTDKKTVELDCRLKCCDGNYSWFLFKGLMTVDNEHNATCLCVLTDINDMKKAQQELNISLQRHNILTAQSDSLIYEYSFDDGSLYLSKPWKPVANYKVIDKPQEDFIALMKETKGVYPDDLDAFVNMFIEIRNGKVCCDNELRMLNNDGQYIWTRIRTSAVFDEEGRVYKTIGKVKDIDKQKHDNDNLKKKAELDSLTGIYNKGTTKTLIDEYLQGDGADGLHAILILDIDNFKNINDNLGHLAGDNVLIEISSRLKRLIRMTDIFGRIGGDEFAILLKNVYSKELVISKATEICNAFHHELNGAGITINVSGSIGIALYKKDGFTYNELIGNADIALYSSKKNGRDQFNFYDLGITAQKDDV